MNINMVIREYKDTDEQKWLRCRVISFLDCSYWNDVKTQKENYRKTCVSYVAEEKGIIVGLMDIEIESDELSYKDKGKGAIIWHVAVLPEFRKDGIARKLWEVSQHKLKENGVCYCECWTQDDIPANMFYQKIGFTLDNSQTWIRCYSKGNTCRSLLNYPAIGNIYGPEELIFQAPLSRKNELMKLCYRINEVRLYTCFI